MTNLLARILLSIMVFPLATLIFILFLFVGLTIDAGSSGPRREEWAFLLATGVTAVFVAGYWFRLWWRSVQWTPRRKLLTIGSGLFMITVGLGTGFGAYTTMQPFPELSPCILLGGVCAIVPWLPMTVVIWRETAAERAERIRQSAGDVLFCPRCGYNLTGLYAAQCPECGARFTLNELYAAQHGEEIADAERSGDRM